MAETADTGQAAHAQPTSGAAPAYKLAPVFLEKQKPVRPPYEPPDRSWIEEWDSDDEDEALAKKDTADRFSRLPVEILMMIASHLTPGSLLAFSRLSRFFRSLVFTKRSESVWREVRRSEGWQDSQAGDLNEVQLANLLEGWDCTVCQGPVWITADFSLRVLLCHACISKLRRKGEEISTEYWHLHPRAFECCLSTRKRSPWLTEELPRGEDSIFFVPEVLKQSAALHKLEAEAVAQNQSPRTVSEAYVVSRGHFRRRAKDDALAWREHKERLRSEANSRFETRRKLRRADINKKLLVLGFTPADCDTLHSGARWCSSCLYQDYDDELAEWEDAYEDAICDRYEERLAEQAEQADNSGIALDPHGARSDAALIKKGPSLEQEVAEFREQSHEEKLTAMLSEWHSDCTPGPSSSLDDFLHFSDERLTEEEWEKYQNPIIDYVHRQRFDRIWSERIAAHNALQKRNDALRPLFHRLRPGIVAAKSGIAISFASFLTLQTVKMINPATIVADEAAMAPFEPQILKEVRDRVRLDKVILFVRLAGFLRNAGHRLSDSLRSVLDREPSPFVDFDPSKGLAPLHTALTDLDMDPLFSQVTPLFRCGICSTKLLYPDIASHLVNEHDVANVPAYAHVPSGDFRKAIKGLLDDLGHSSQLELSAFEVFYSDCRFDVATRTGGGELRMSIGETWEQVLSGKSPAELEASRHKLSHSTDRDIVEIKLSYANAGSDEDALRRAW